MDVGMSSRLAFVLLGPCVLACASNGNSNQGPAPAAGPAAAEAAAAPDASSAASRCKNDKLLFCEDFESGMLDPAVWTVTRLRNAPVTVDGLRAARGRYAFHAGFVDVTYPYENGGWITTKQSFPVAGKRLFVRAFVFVGPTVPTRWFSTIQAIRTGDPIGASLTDINLVPWPPPGGSQTDVRFRVLGVMGPNGKQTTYRAAIGSWSCWQWELRGTDNTMHFSVDDKPVDALTISTEWTAPGSARLMFGYHTHHPEPLYPAGLDVVFIDEIAVSQEPIGCQ
jgi:hypothetical protein